MQRLPERPVTACRPLEVFEEISGPDGSVGWTIVIGNSTAFFAWLDPFGAKELIADQPDFVSTSMWAPLGQATGQPGGSRIWPLAVQQRLPARCLAPGRRPGH